MVLLYPLTRQFESKLLEWETRRKLAGLTDRNLADIGLERSDIRQFARAASQPNVSATPPRSPVMTELPVVGQPQHGRADHVADRGHGPAPTG